MSSRSKSKVALGQAAATEQDAVGSDREKKSSMFGAKQQKAKPRQAEAPNTSTELARLLANRTRALLAFEEPSFGVAAFLSSHLAALSEQAIANASSDLGGLLAAATREVEGVVAAHHARFLAACEGVEALEDSVALLRNYTNGLTALVGSLKATLKAAGSSGQAHGSPRAWQAARHLPGDDVSSTVAATEADMELLLQELDLASAGRDLAGAVSWLAAAEAVGSVLDRDASALLLEGDDFPGWRHSYDAALGLRKQHLVASLQRQLSDANASAAEIRAACGALAELVGGATALQAMLGCYSSKIQLSQALVLKQHTAGSDPDSCEFAGGLVQRTLLEVAAAADGSVAIFGVGERQHASLFTVWAAREVRGCAALLRRHVLSTAAATASTGLHTTAQVVAMCQVFCAMLEHSHSISLTGIMTAELWPSVDSALRRHLKRFTDELRMAATEEVNSLVLGCLGGSRQVAAGGLTGLVAGSLLCREAAALARVLEPIGSPRLAATFRQALLDCFTAATQTVGFTLRSHLEAAPDPDALAPLLPAVMEALAGVIEEGLPDAVARLAAAAGPLVDARGMDRALNALYRDVSAAGKAARMAEAAAAAAAAGDGGG